MNRWVRHGIWLMNAAAVMLSLSICNAYAAQDASAVPDARSGLGQSCGGDADCATGLTCFQSGPPRYINYCTGEDRPVLHPFKKYGGPNVPAKTCNTASDCGLGDWTCHGICITTGGRRCTTNADCVGG
jgi:hypothetical protein